MISTIGMALLLVPVLSLAQAPHQVGGLVLDQNISHYQKLVRMESALPIRFREYLREVTISQLEGFKSGRLWYGTGNSPGCIVRISLKYADSSKAFFDTLLERFEERFGEPSEWRGDPFHLFIAWKWSFTDRDNNRISLILQHNTKNPEEKKGNCVKLTNWTMVEKERACFEENHPELSRSHAKQGQKASECDPADWDNFIPR